MNNKVKEISDKINECEVIAIHVRSIAMIKFTTLNKPMIYEVNS